MSRTLAWFNSAPETLQPKQHGPSLMSQLGCHHLSRLLRPAAGKLRPRSRRKLAHRQGLRLSDVLDGCGKQLQDLIQYSTNPDVMGRYGTIDEFP